MVCACAVERSWVGSPVVGIIGQLPDDVDEAKSVNASRLQRLASRKPLLTPSGRLVAMAWDALIRWFGEEIIPELEAMSVRDVIELYLTV